MEQLTIHLSILLFWPLALALLGAIDRPPRRARDRGLSARSSRSATRSCCCSTSTPAAAACSTSPTTPGSRRSGSATSSALDGLNLWLVALTTLLFAAAALWVVLRPVERPRLFTFHLALAETAVLGAFLAQDLALFVLFFDLMLVPFYFLVGQWGSGGREEIVAATYKLIIYTLVGSLLMLAGAVATAVLSADGGTVIVRALGPRAGRPRRVDPALDLRHLRARVPDQDADVPVPRLDARRATARCRCRRWRSSPGCSRRWPPTASCKIVLPLFPAAAQDYQTLILVLALLSIVYGSAQAFTQTNTRLVLGYSSVAQLGFIVLGIFAFDPEGRGGQGAVLQMVNHGLVVAPLFFIVALLAERAGGSEDIRDMGGLAFRAPVLASLFLIAALATLAMPGSANFVGEFLILLGLFETKLAMAVIAFSGVVLASVYMLRMYIRSMHNRPGERTDSRELTVGDALVIVPLVLLIIAFALYPQAALRDSEPSVKASIQEVVR